MLESLISTFLPYLDQHLTPARVQHSLGVMRTMVRLADMYDLDTVAAPLAGLLHDIAKDLEPDRMVEIAKVAGVSIGHACEWHPMYLHGPVGAHLAQTELGITDEVVLEAIAKHTFYSSDPFSDTKLSWCLRFADLSEPGRSFYGIKKFRHSVFSGAFWESALLETSWIIEFFPELTIPVHPNFFQVQRSLMERLDVDDDFFKRG